MGPCATDFVDEAGQEADANETYEDGALWPRRAAHERDYFPTVWNAMVGRCSLTLGFRS